LPLTTGSIEEQVVDEGKVVESYHNMQDSLGRRGANSCQPFGIDTLLPGSGDVLLWVGAIYPVGVSTDLIRASYIYSPVCGAMICRRPFCAGFGSRNGFDEI
jgi:hypothetical protein